LEVANPGSDHRSAQSAHLQLIANLTKRAKRLDRSRIRERLHRRFRARIGGDQLAHRRLQG
jgi:hypothetical protein